MTLLLLLLLLAGEAVSGEAWSVVGCSCLGECSSNHHEYMYYLIGRRELWLLPWLLSDEALIDELDICLCPDEQAVDTDTGKGITLESVQCLNRPSLHVVCNIMTLFYSQYL